jgi:hypothetical protein
MRETLDVLNRMVADRVIGRYAIGRAVATYNYIEATVTDDLDILIAVDAFEERPRSSLVLLTPITQYLAERGYTEWRNEGIVIGGWPVQFLPVSSKLDAEALDHALDHVIRIGVSDSVETRILRAEHLVAIALKVGRPKDHIRIAQFLEAGAVDTAYLCAILGRHGLRSRWQEFCDRAGISNPCELHSAPDDR